MSQSNNTPHDPFDERLSTLLSRAANDMRPAPDFARQVRRRAQAHDTHRAWRPAFGLALPSLRSVGSFALVAALVSALVWLLLGHGAGLHISLLGMQPGGDSSAQNCDNSLQYYVSSSNAPKPLDNSTALGVSATSNGVTITLDRAYADATQTVVTYHVTPDTGFTTEYPVLIDASGTRYTALDNSSIGAYGHFTAILLFAPLPQSALGSPQRLTIHANSVQSTAVNPGATPAVLQNHVQGAWNIPFTITPVAGVAIPLTLPAQTHAGITIQPEEADTAPAGGGLDGQNGGMRVRFRISGLPATMPLVEVAHYISFFQAGPGGFSTGGGCGGTLTLGLPTGKPLIPGRIIPSGLATLESPTDITKWNSQTVGGSGSVEVQALFFAPMPTGSGTVKLTFDHIPLATSSNGQIVETRAAEGPWVFSIHLNP